MVSVHEMKVVSVQTVRMAILMISINVDSSALRSSDAAIIIVLILFLVRVALLIKAGMVLLVSRLLVIMQRVSAVNDLHCVKKLAHV
jgi:hypothetical protein